MGEAATRGLTIAVALRLGRVSNLPTVWTNVLAGLALSGAAFSLPLFLALVLAFSLFYIAGMYLNDAFDREIDARERPERPIPSGGVSARTVFTAGFLLLAAGWILLVLIGCVPEDGTLWRLPLVGALLAGAIVLYDYRHKGNPLSPLLMGVCRMLVYIGAALAAATWLSPELIVAALVALSYLIGLTYAAKQEGLNRLENLWPLAFLAMPVGYALWVAGSGLAGIAAAAAFIVWLVYSLSYLVWRDRRNVPHAVLSLLAGICLLDALFIVAAGHAPLASVAGLGFLLTLALQRHVPGT
jgi:hypothetical protein